MGVFGHFILNILQSLCLGLFIPSHKPLVLSRLGFGPAPAENSFIVAKRVILNYHFQEKKDMSSAYILAQKLFLRPIIFIN